MGEILSPNPNTTQKHRSIANRIQSPTSPFFLGSNDDNLERAQARAARAAAIRRKSVALHAQPPPQNADPGLGKQQILELFHNCIKLASENKINQKNTWELGLIDHLCEIIKVEEENDTETNFQKASCTLEAGVKIYSLRVDSVHSEAYKVLGGINRAGQDNEQDGVVEDPHVEDGREQGTSKKDVDKKISPLSTLEPSFEALNVKKFDVAFAVDPLYHQTSAQFDEGGAKGLLLNNLGVYGGCRVLFDSLEVPGKCTSCSSQNNMSDTIDISFARDCIEQMMTKMQTNGEISPSLGQIVNLFDEDNKRPADVPTTQNLEEQMDGISSSEGVFDADTSYDENTWGVNQDDDAAAPDESSNFENPAFPSYGEENEPFSFNDPDKENRFDEVEEYLFLSLGYNSKQNAWAGPDHWKYQKPKALEENHNAENVSPATSKRPRNKKQLESDIDFTSSLDKEIPDLFVPPKSSKSLLLPASRAPCNTKLPEDCHYQPENLVKLFLLPNIMCLGRNKRKQSDDLFQSHDDNGPSTSWDDGSVFDGQFDGGNAPSDGEEHDNLVSQPRQVSKIEVRYDKTSKQVDVQALKETLWDRIKISPETPVKVAEEPVSFKQILASFPPDCRAAATPSDISPHLCFICLLHLANEHGLSLHGCTNLDDLSIHLPGHYM